MPQVKETTWDLLISGDKLNEVAIPRCKEHIESKVPNEKVDSYYAEGWNHLKTNKKNTTIYKEKPIGTAFEDEVWSIFYNMGFKIMNENNKFAIVYGEQTKVSKQIDIVAIDDETCLFIECKESWKYDTKRNLQMDINEVPSYFAKCSNVIKSKYPNLKFRYIFATKNINVSQVDKSRMLENGIVHFDYATILYYKALVCHLGSAAKYQLLGQLFAGQNIQNIEARIPAIRGKMGAYTYNGLYRVNSSGQFNVPLGKYKNPDIVFEDKILEIHDYLINNNIEIMSVDFEVAVQSANAGDLVYFDPPYDYDDSGFTSYTCNGFSKDDLKRLKNICDDLISKGCKVVVSNNDTAFVNQLFDHDSYHIKHVMAKRMINCKGQQRNFVKEVVIYG